MAPFCVVYNMGHSIALFLVVVSELGKHSFIFYLSIDCFRCLRLAVSSNLKEFFFFNVVHRQGQNVVCRR